MVVLKKLKKSYRKFEIAKSDYKYERDRYAKEFVDMCKKVSRIVGPFKTTYDNCFIEFTDTMIKVDGVYPYSMKKDKIKKLASNLQGIVDKITADYDRKQKDFLDEN